MMYWRVRSLRSRRPSVSTWLEDRAIGARSRRRSRRQQAIDGADPNRARLLGGQAKDLAHAPPAFEIGQRLERDQSALALALVQPRQLGPIHDLETLCDHLAGKPN